MTRPFPDSAAPPAGFTLWHGLAGSLALHGLFVFGLLLWLNGARGDMDDTLVVEFEGVNSDVQAGEQHRRETAGAGGAEAAQSATPGSMDEETKRDEVQPPVDGDPPADKKDKVKGAAASGASSEPLGRESRAGGDNEQSAQTLQRRAAEEMSVLEAYVQKLSRKIQSKLVYPKEGRHAGMQGVTTVSFRILDDGGILPESLKVVVSSGRPELDASALHTIEASVHFVAPPRALTVTLAVTYGRKR
jgi:protein TonB